MEIFNFLKKRKTQAIKSNQLLENDYLLEKDLNERVINGISNFDLGILGVFQKNKIKIYGKFNELVKIGFSQSENEFIDILITSITKFNKRIAYLKDNLKNYILLRWLNNIYYTGSFIGGTEKAYLTDYKKFSQEDCDKICESVVTDDVEIEIEKYSKRGLLYNSKFDAENFIKQNFKFFNYSTFISGLNCKYVDFSFYYNRKTCVLEIDMSIQFSDKYECVYCDAYEKFTEKLLPIEWHNF